jgi:hypothetical protein
VGRVDRRAHERRRRVHPGPGARQGQAVPHAHRGRLHDHRSWHRRHGPRRAWHAGHQLRGRDRRHPPDAEDHRHRYRDVPQAARRGLAGENCGLLLRGTKRDDVERGQVVVKPGSVTPHTDFEGTAYILSKDEGGRHNPFFTNYRPQFYFRTTDVTGVITLPEGTEMVMPGDTTEMTVELIQPIAMEEGLGFAIREGGRTVGAGTVTKILK